MTEFTLGDPVFIGGYPKSGTTLLCSLLDGHEDLVVIPEETKYFRRRVNQASSSDFHAELLAEVSADFGKTVHASSGFRDYRDIDPEIFLNAARKYWINSDRSEKRELESVAVGVHKALGFSGLRQELTSPRRYQVNRNVDRPKPLGNFISGWNVSNQYFQNAKYSGLDSFLIRYEDLVVAREQVMKDVVDFLGIRFTPDMIKPTKAGLVWAGNSSQGEGSIGGHVPREIVDNIKLRTSERRFIEYALGSLMSEGMTQSCHGFTCRRGCFTAKP